MNPKHVALSAFGGAVFAGASIFAGLNLPRSPATQADHDRARHEREIRICTEVERRTWDKDAGMCLENADAR